MFLKRCRSVSFANRVLVYACVRECVRVLGWSRTGGKRKKFQIRLFAVTVGRRDVVTSCPMRCDHRRDANPPNVQHSIFTLNNAIRPCRL